MEKPNRNWQQEYTRWYGRPNTPRSGRRDMHWLIRLTICSMVFLVAYTASKQLLFPEPKPTVAQAPAPSPVVKNSARTTTPAQPQPRPEPPIVIENASQRIEYRTAPPTLPTPQQPGIDPYTAALARQADERIARQNAEAQAQQGQQAPVPEQQRPEQQAGHRKEPADPSKLVRSSIGKERQPQPFPRRTKPGVRARSVDTPPRGQLQPDSDI